MDGDLGDHRGMRRGDALRGQSDYSDVEVTSNDMEVCILTSIP